MGLALARHEALLRKAIESNQGYVFKEVGDAFCAAFTTAPNALQAVVEAQLGLTREDWGEIGSIRVRAALHTGVAEERKGDYFGPTLNRVARLLGIGHGGQTLLSEATYELVKEHLLPDISLADLGSHRLRDLSAPERVWQLQHPSLPGSHPPLKSLDCLPTNLAPQVTSFIGREREIAKVKELLSGTRLLTLTGSGGTGKTRLALQVAAEGLEEYPDGVWLAELAPINDPDLVTQTVAEAMTVLEAPGQPILKTLLDSVKGKRCLLLLDNCEHLLEASANLADALLHGCPKLQVLATSREALGIAGESTYRVPSLSVPGLHQTQTPEGLIDFESVRLFVERAKAVRSDFEVTPRNAPSLAAVCHRLDGIPLALELAAARVTAMPVEQIETRLDGCFRLLTGGSRTAMPRQQTLRALIDWSYDLLNDQERTLLSRISVFQGGWRLESAEEVCVGGGVEKHDVLDLLSSLVGKSLVVYIENEGVARYRLLETVRQYALDRQEESGQADALREKHLNHFLAFAHQAASHLKGADQAEWFRRLDEEHENLRTTLQRSVANVESSADLQLCGDLMRFWMTRGFLSEGRVWSERALNKEAGLRRTKERAVALGAAGVIAWMQGDYPEARSRHEEALSIRRELGDQSGIAASLGNLGLVAMDASDYPGAQAFHVESLRIRRELGDPWSISASLNNLGLVELRLGSLQFARDCFEESLTLCKETGDVRGIASAFNNLGIAAYDQGDYVGSKLYCEEGLTVSRQIGDFVRTAVALNNLGIVAYEQHNFELALAYLEEGLAIRKEIGDRWGIATSHHNLGSVAFQVGDYGAAQELERKSLAIREEIGDRVGIITSLESFASLALKGDKPQLAATLWGAADKLREDLNAPLPENKREGRNRECTEALQTLGDVAFDTAKANGRALELKGAIALALDGPTV
jgi:predicted ATPase